MQDENLRTPVLAHGEQGIAAGGHRAYVGGKWEEIGKLQFDFLCSQGLKPEHVFLDVACGSLRGGVYFIPYLNAGNYLGIEKEEQLLQAGLLEEVGEELALEKKPEFVISSAFAFEHFSKEADFALAQSLFSHLTEDLILTCLEKLRPQVKTGCRFFATFFESEKPSANPSVSHDHKNFQYTRSEMEAFGRRTNWQPNYIGDWGHPRDQKMMEFIAR